MLTLYDFYASKFSALVTPTYAPSFYFWDPVSPYFMLRCVLLFSVNFPVPLIYIDCNQTTKNHWGPVFWTKVTKSILLDRPQTDGADYIGTAVRPNGQVQKITFGKIFEH